MNAYTSFYSVSPYGPCPYNGIREVRGENNVEFARNTLRRCGEIGTWALSVKGGTIHHNLLIDSCGGIDPNFAENILIENNVSFGWKAETSPKCYQAGGPLIGPAWSKDIVIRNNTLITDSAGVDVGIYLGDRELGPWETDAGFTFVASEKIDVRNNIVVSPAKAHFGTNLAEHAYQAAYNSYLNEGNELLDLENRFVAPYKNSRLQNSGDPAKEYNNKDSSLNTPGAFGGPQGTKWFE